MSSCMSSPSNVVVHFLSLVSVPEPQAFDRNMLFGRERKGYPTYQLANTQVSNRLASYLTSKLTNTVADKLAGKFSEVDLNTLPAQHTWPRPAEETNRVSSTHKKQRPVRSCKHSLHCVRGLDTSFLSRVCLLSCLSHQFLLAPYYRL